MDCNLPYYNTSATNTTGTGTLTWLYPTTHITTGIGIGTSIPIIYDPNAANVTASPPPPDADWDDFAIAVGEQLADIGRRLKALEALPGVREALARVEEETPPGRGTSR